MGHPFSLLAIESSPATSNYGCYGYRMEPQQPSSSYASSPSFSCPASCCLDTKTRAFVPLSSAFPSFFWSLRRRFGLRKHWMALIIRVMIIVSWLHKRIEPIRRRHESQVSIGQFEGFPFPPPQRYRDIRRAGARWRLFRAQYRRGNPQDHTRGSSSY